MSTRPTAAQASTARRAALASLVGTTIEWFDFFIYGTAAALVFGDLFFPAVDEHSARLASFATLGVAFLARPIGAAVFGHFGDRLGRRATLVTTLALMGAATGLIGCLPTYDTIGVWAPVLLIVLRLLQGAAVGGEWGGAVLMSVEHAPASRVRLYGAAPQIGSPLGLVLSTAVMSAVAALPESSLLTWGWRIPFLAGFVLVLVGLVIRLGVEESDDFQRLKEDGRTSRLPLRDVCTRAWRQLLLGIGLQASVNVVFYVISVFFLSYASNALGFQRTTALLIVSFAATVDLLALPLFAHLSDRLGAHRVFTAGVAFTVIAAYPFFWLVNSGNTMVVTLTVTLMMVCAHATTYAVISSMTAGLFHSSVRYSGTSLSNALGGLVFSAPTPLIAEAVIGPDGTRWWPLGTMAVIAGVISLFTIRAMPRTASHHDSREPADGAIPVGTTPQGGSPA
ncbi:MFS transporter [Streptomyces sp. NPDC052042]|uniref:MFS transporter n=1 Tax=Streptomyces sp. NPDC052042 TaxID=3365683 RepID=UPI0037D7F667